MKEGVRVTVVAAVIEKDGKFLIARRHKSDKLGGKWEFPGGKVEQGELPEEALRRELMEELSIDAEIGDFICSTSHDYPHMSVGLLAYRASFSSGEIILRVHEEIRWVAPEDLVKYDFPEANRGVIRKLVPGEIHF